jgi:hypothetical protein
MKGGNMEESLLSIINYISFENVIVASIIFALTMIIKIPIKNISSTHKEPIRKGINSIITIIPITLSIILNVLYFKIVDKTWISFSTAKAIINSWLISVSIYALYERIKILIKAFKNNELNKELLDENKLFMKKEISNLIEMIDTNQKSLKEIEYKITRLNNYKKSNPTSLSTIFKTNIELKELSEKEIIIKQHLGDLENKLQTIKTEDF